MIKRERTTGFTARTPVYNARTPHLICTRLNREPRRLVAGSPVPTRKRLSYSAPDSIANPADPRQGQEDF